MIFDRAILIVILIFTLPGKILSRGWLSSKETLAQIKRARRPRTDMEALGLLAGAGDGHYCANAAQKSRKYEVRRLAKIDRFRADVHRRFRR